MEFLSALWKVIGSNASELIAIAALTLAIWQGYIARRHNKLSVRPHLSFVSTFSHKAPHILVDLKNNGIGTAIITEYIVILDGEIQKKNSTSYVREACEKLKIPNRYSTAARHFSIDGSISSGQTENVLKIIRKNDDYFDHGIAEKELNRIQFIIKYMSLYGDVFEVKFDST